MSNSPYGKPDDGHWGSANPFSRGPGQMDFAGFYRRPEEPASQDQFSRAYVAFAKAIDTPSSQGFAAAVPSNRGKEVKPNTSRALPSSAYQVPIAFPIMAGLASAFRNVVPSGKKP